MALDWQIFARSLISGEILEKLFVAISPLLSKAYLYAGKMRISNHSIGFEAFIQSNEETAVNADDLSRDERCFV